MPDDASEMVTIPDQDWVAFGVWLTAPDNMADGVHDIGVFYDGMETYTATNSPGRNGDIRRQGGRLLCERDHARPVHRRRVADRDLCRHGGDTLSGSIQNFRDSQGRYIDSDNPNTPNDPNQGGENDWGVMLASTPLDDSGSLGTSPTVVPLAPPAARRTA